MFDCDAPLGMENGEISNDQITAKHFQGSSTGPLKSRLRGNSKWCPQAEVIYAVRLQLMKSFLSDVSQCILPSSQLRKHLPTFYIYIESFGVARHIQKI